MTKTCIIPHSQMHMHTHGHTHMNIDMDTNTTNTLQKIEIKMSLFTGNMIDKENPKDSTQPL